jgi:hypothetical protein
MRKAKFPKLNVSKVNFHISLLSISSIYIMYTEKTNCELASKNLDIWVLLIGGYLDVSSSVLSPVLTRRLHALPMKNGHK